MITAGLVRRQFPSYLSTPLVPESIARVDGEFVKDTRSYCPTCMRQVNAVVYIVGELVWLYKTCPEHGPSQGLLERDPAFYRAVRNIHPHQKMKNYAIVIPITHQCNLHCGICFVPNRQREDLSTDAIKKLIDELDVEFVTFSGGEPTLRDDLPELIRHTRKVGKSASLNTNGIRMADKDYVKMLTDTGLENVILSYNGFNDEIYIKMNGRPLLDIKRQALDNLAENKLNILLSPTFMRSINEDIRPLLKLCLEYSPYVIEMRTRNAAHVGRHGKFEPLVLSEMFLNLAIALERPVDEILKRMDRSTFHHSINQWIMEGVFFANGERKDELYHWSAGAYMGRYYYTPPSPLGFVMQVRWELGGDLSSLSLRQRFKFLNIVMWCWPDLYNVDLEEIESHGILHLFDNRIAMNFYEAMFRACDL